MRPVDLWRIGDGPQSQHWTNRAQACRDRMPMPRHRTMAEVDAEQFVRAVAA